MGGAPRRLWGASVHRLMQRDISFGNIPSWEAVRRVKFFFPLKRFPRVTFFFLPPPRARSTARSSRLFFPPSFQNRDDCDAHKTSFSPLPSSSISPFPLPVGEIKKVMAERHSFFPFFERTAPGVSPLLFFPSQEIPSSPLPRAEKARPGGVSLLLLSVASSPPFLGRRGGDRGLFSFLFFPILLYQLLSFSPPSLAEDKEIMVQVFFLPFPLLRLLIPSL